MRLDRHIPRHVQLNRIASPVAVLPITVGVVFGIGISVLAIQIGLLAAGLIICGLLLSAILLFLVVQNRNVERRILDEIEKTTKEHIIQVRDAPHGRLVLPEIVPQGAFQIYIEYKYLRLSHLIRLMECINSIYKETYLMLSRVERDSSYSSEGIQIEDGIPTKDHLEVSHIQTGNSVVFEFITGWVPDIQVVASNVHILIPKGAAVLGAVGTLLFLAAERGSQLIKTLLELKQMFDDNDDKKTKNSKQRKQEEKLLKDLQYVDEDQIEELEFKLGEFLKQTNMHPDIRQVKIIRPGELSILTPYQAPRSSPKIKEHHLIHRKNELRKEIQRLEDERDELTRE